MPGPRTLRTEPLTREAFAPFGQVIESEGAHHYPINAGNCERYHDLAKVELGGVDARPLISLMHSRGFALPYTLMLVERHPLGSQAFYPLSQHPFLVVVAPDESGTPGIPRAFLTSPRPGREHRHEHLARRTDADRSRGRFPLRRSRW